MASSYWQNKVAVVTGGSRGLGRAIAEAFYGARAKVVVVARDRDALARAAAEMRDAGADVLAVPADITDDAQVNAVVAQTLERYGKIDVLVNNAGRSSRGDAIRTSVAEFRDLLELNFLALVRCTQAALPQLLQTGGHIVNIGSLSAKTASPYMGAYPASKFPVAAYSHQLRLELAPHGVHVLLVCPGPISRTDAGRRYDTQATGLPESAAQPGGGAQLAPIDPKKVAQKILKYCEHRKPEIVMPAKARLMFALAQLSPRLGDWIIRRKTKS